jgi:hypothetical protein
VINLFFRACVLYIAASGVIGLTLLVAVSFVEDSSPRSPAFIDSAFAAIPWLLVPPLISVGGGVVWIMTTIFWRALTP